MAARTNGRQSEAAGRAKRTVARDKLTAIESMLGVLKSEMYRLLTNYMYLSERDLSIYIDITDAGEYVLNVQAVTDRLIDVGRILE